MSLDLISRLNLLERSSTERKDGAYVINVDEYSDIGTHWVALQVHNNDVTYFDSFGVEHIPKELRMFINRRLSSTLQNKNKKQKSLEYKHMIQ